MSGSHSFSDTPQITIITPTKNRLALLRETVESVQNQTFTAWEHVIVDDGSDDGTVEEFTRRAENDSRIRLIQRKGEKSGANVCRNLGISASKADLVVFLDSDDLLFPHCLERRVAIMQRNLDLDFVTFQTEVFEKSVGDLNRQHDPSMLGDDLLRFLFFEVPWIITAPTWRRSALDQLKGFDESLPSWQDIDLHIRAIISGCQYVRFPEVDHAVRWQFEPTKVSIEQRRSPKHLEAGLIILEKFEKLVREGPGMDWIRQRALCSLYFFIAEQWVRAGYLGKALRSWKFIRSRNLGGVNLHVMGIIILSIFSINRPIGSRLLNKWRGWARLRTNPELVSS